MKLPKGSSKCPICGGANTIGHSCVHGFFTKVEPANTLKIAADEVVRPLDEQMARLNTNLIDANKQLKPERAVASLIAGELRECFSALQAERNARANADRVAAEFQTRFLEERKAREEAERNLGEYVNGSEETLAGKLFDCRQRVRVLDGKWFDADCQEKGCQSLIYLNRATAAAIAASQEKP